MIFGCNEPFSKDEVLATYNVYMTAPSSAKAHVFQFPTRTIARPLEMNAAKLYMAEGGAASANGLASSTTSDTLSPSSRVTMRCDLDTFGSPSFKNQDQRNLFDEEDGTLYRYTLQSHPFQPRSDYVLGRISDGGIHLTPVTSLHSFMPTAHTAMEKSGPITARDGPCTVEGPFCSTRANASDNSPMSERVEREMMRQRSAILNKAADAAVAVRFYTAQAPESKEAKRKLVSHITGSVDAKPASVRQVQDSLYPPEILSSGGITGGEENQHCIIHAFASRKGIPDQVYDLLQRCHVLPFTHVMDRVVAEGDAASVEIQVLDSLKQYGCFMHGVWVSQNSEKFRGTAAALRDIVLVHFYQSADGSVSRRDLNALTPSSAQRKLVKDIMDSLAVLDLACEPSARRWKLRYVSADDALRAADVQAFAQRFPVESAHQQNNWQKRCAEARGYLPYLRANMMPPHLQQQQQQHLRHSAPSGHGTGAGAVASSLAAAPTEDDLRPIRQYITTLFKEHGVLNKSRAKELILRGREVHCPTATNEMLSLALKSLVREFTPNTWVLYASGEPKIDKYRPLLLDILRTMPTFKSAEVPPRVEEALLQRQSVGGDAEKRETVPSSTIQAVITEVAEFRTGDRLWYLRSGHAMTD